MKFDRASLSLAHLWSSPFVRWQGSLADVSSLDLAVAVTGDALAARGVDRGAIDSIVLGSTDRGMPPRNTPSADSDAKRLNLSPRAPITTRNGAAGRRSTTAQPGAHSVCASPSRSVQPVSGWT